MKKKSKKNCSWASLLYSKRKRRFVYTIANIQLTVESFSLETSGISSMYSPLLDTVSCLLYIYIYIQSHAQFPWRIIYIIFHSFFSNELHKSFAIFLCEIRKLFRRIFVENENGKKTKKSIDARIRSEKCWIFPRRFFDKWIQYFTLLSSINPSDWTLKETKNQIQFL